MKKSRKQSTCKGSKLHIAYYKGKMFVAEHWFTRGSLGIETKEELEALLGDMHKESPYTFKVSDG